MSQPTLIYYRDYIISDNPPCARDFKFQFVHEEYDGPEDHRHGDGKTIEDCKHQIDEKESEHPRNCGCAECNADEAYERHRERMDGL